MQQDCTGHLDRRNLLPITVKQSVLNREYNSTLVTCQFKNKVSSFAVKLLLCNNYFTIYKRISEFSSITSPSPAYLVQGDSGARTDLSFHKAKGSSLLQEFLFM